MKSYSAQEVYQKLDISHQFLSRLVSTGVIERIGRGRYSAEDVEKYFNKKYTVDEAVSADIRDFLSVQKNTLKEPVGVTNWRKIRDILLDTPQNHWDSISNISQLDVERLTRSTDEHLFKAFMYSYGISKNLNLPCHDYFATVLSSFNEDSGLYLTNHAVHNEQGKVVAVIQGAFEFLKIKPFYTFDVKHYTLVDVLHHFEQESQLFTKSPTYIKTHVDDKYQAIRIKSLDQDHTTKSQHLELIREEDFVIEFFRSSGVSITGTRIDTNNGYYVIDNNVLDFYNDDRVDTHLNTIDLSDYKLSDERKVILDKLYNHFKPVVEFLMVHLMSTSNNRVLLLSDQGGTGKDFLIDILMFMLRDKVAKEANFVFTNMGATRSNPARANRVLRGNQLIVLSELNEEHFKNQWDTFLKDYVGNVDRVGKAKLAENVIPFTTSFVGTINPKTHSGVYEELNIRHTNVTRRLWVLDIEDFCGNITDMWKLADSSYNELRYSSKDKRTIRMNELSFVWEYASTRDRCNASKYFLTKILKDMSTDYYDLPEKPAHDKQVDLEWQYTKMIPDENRGLVSQLGLAYGIPKDNKHLWTKFKSHIFDNKPFKYLKSYEGWKSACFAVNDMSGEFGELVRKLFYTHNERLKQEKSQPRDLSLHNVDEFEIMYLGRDKKPLEKFANREMYSISSITDEKRICVLTRGVVVIDVDDPARFPTELSDLCHTGKMTISVSGRGVHYYFLEPEPNVDNTSITDEKKVVDIKRGVNAYCVENVENITFSLNDLVYPPKDLLPRLEEFIARTN